MAGEALTHPDPSRLRATPSISDAIGAGGLEVGDEGGGGGGWDWEMDEYVIMIGVVRFGVAWCICICESPRLPDESRRRRRRRGGWVAGVALGRGRAGSREW